MATRQIERENWAGFLDSISKSHAGKLASLEAFGPGTGSHSEVRALPFGGFEIETATPGQIVVMIGTDSDDHISHAVSKPIQVWHKSGADEADEVVEVRSSDGVSVIVRFAIG